MKTYISRLSLIALTLVPLLKASAQTSGERPDKLYTMSGAGFSFPVGEAADYLKPKFSTSLGLNIGLGAKGWFLYPKASLHAYRYDELERDPGYTHALQKGRATTYLLNLALGYRHTTGKTSFYGFVGGGGGVILTPRISVDPGTLTAELENKSNSMGMIESGAGIERSLGGAALFIEASYMHGFSKLQNRNFAAVPITVGIKPNLSKLLKKKS